MDFARLLSYLLEGLRGLKPRSSWLWPGSPRQEPRIAKFLSQTTKQEGIARRGTATSLFMNVQGH